MTIQPRSPYQDNLSPETFERCYQERHKNHQGSEFLATPLIDELGREAIISLQEIQNDQPTIQSRSISSLALDDPELSFEQIKDISLAEWIEAIRQSPHQSVLYSNTVRGLFEEKRFVLNSTVTLSKEDLLERAIELNPLNISAVYYRFISTTSTQVLETDLMSQKQYLDAQMKNTMLSLEQVYCIPKELWILAIQENPQEPMLYLHLARRVEMGEEVLLQDNLKMTWYELYVESIKLQEDHVQSYLFLAKRLIEYKEKYSLFNPNVFYLNPELLYLKAIEIDPLHPDAYLGLTDCLIKDAKIDVNNILMTSEELCLKVIKEHPCHSQGYSHLAKLLRVNPALLEKYGTSYFKELLLKALELDSHNMNAYLTLYEGWNLITQENTIQLFEGQYYQKEDLLITAMTLSPHHQDLRLFYVKESVLKDPCFFSFLEKLSLTPLSSKGKLYIYQQLLTAVFYKEEIKNQVYKYVKYLIEVIRKEYPIHLNSTLKNKKFSQEVAVAYQKIGKKFPLNQQIREDFYKIWNAKFWAKALCFHHESGLSYVLIAQQLEDYNQNMMRHYSDDQKVCLMGFFYLTAIDINPNLLKGYWGLYCFADFRPSQSRKPQVPLKSDIFFDGPLFCSKKPIPLINGSSLSKNDLCQRILILAGEQVDCNSLPFAPSLRDLSEMIHRYKSQEVSYDTFFKQVENRKITPLHLSHLYLEMLKIEVELKITDSETHKLLINLAQSVKRLGPITSLEETTSLQIDLFILYPQMIDPVSSLEELTKISDEVWKKALHTSPRNSYFYCNLARHLSFWTTLDQYGKRSSLFYSYSQDPLCLNNPHIHRDFIYNLYFKSLQLNPANQWTYYYLAENLPMIYRGEQTRTLIEMEYLYLLCIHLNPKRYLNYCALLQLNRGKECYELLDGTSITEQDLFIKILSLNLEDQKDVFLFIKKANQASFGSYFYQDVLQIELPEINKLSEQQREQYVRKGIQHLQQEFPDASVYFKLSSEHYPYIQYDIKESKFCFRCYPLDYLSGVFQEVTGKTSYFDFKQLAKWFYVNSLLTDNPLLSLELINKSFISRLLKLKLYEALLQAISTIPFNDDISDYKSGSYNKDDFKDPTDKMLTYKLAADIALQLRRGENVAHDLGDQKLKSFSRFYPSLKNFLPHPVTTGFSSRIQDELKNKITDEVNFQKEEFKQLKERVANPHSRYSRGNMHASKLFAYYLNEYQNVLPIDETAAKKIYNNVLSFYLNTQVHWLLPDDEMKALFYTKLAQSLNENEHVQIIKNALEAMENLEGDKEDQLRFTPQIIDRFQELEDDENNISILKKYSKKDLYFEAIQSDPSLKYAYLEMEKLLKEAVQVQMDESLSQEELSSFLVKELKTSLALEKRKEMDSSDYNMRNKLMSHTVSKLDHMKYSRSSVIYTFETISHFYLKMIDLYPNQPYPYYFLAQQLSDEEEIKLMNGVRLTTHQLYRRSVQLGIEESRAYYKAAIHLRERGGVALFDEKTVLSKQDLLTSAFLLSQDSYFYLKEWVWHLVREASKT
ncbi:hypothetical protein [Rhabdochlamydiaceae symbiont of Dictyostelium giganteum]|uniref:hypothetical protein n=1 Tax=Rhabdochlamydiaceae symbiont of Dictyostelium giganteum TaxID=3342349 RepID=UPI00384F3F4D